MTFRQSHIHRYYRSICAFLFAITLIEAISAICCSSSTLHLQTEDHAQELLIVDFDVSITVGVLLAKRSSQRLENHAQLDEIVEVDTTHVGAVKLSHEQIVEALRKTIAELSEGIHELSSVNVPGIVSIVAAESLTPVIDVVPKRLEFRKTDSPVVVRVEHRDHHPASFWVKCTPSAI